jgi:hypothetical protein
MNTAKEFAHFVKGLGFRAFVAEPGLGRGGYGFITDAEGSRVLSFSFNDGGSLGGNYGPPSQESGTGWRIDGHPLDLKTAHDVYRALYAHPPRWCGKGWKNLTTLEQHLQTYGKSSNYREI